MVLTAQKLNSTALLRMNTTFTQYLYGSRRSPWQRQRISKNV